MKNKKLSRISAPEIQYSILKLAVPIFWILPSSWLMWWDLTAETERISVVSSGLEGIYPLIYA